ncbi:MAG: hypothetical protein HY048_19325 [Acidobacteria bacterium]|nr:hypothetical protein [Acidobacteriota bacterium]
MLLLLTPSVQAQDQEQHPPEHHHVADPAPVAAWTWTSDANAFYGYNYQQRKFADFWAWESQNWFIRVSPLARSPAVLRRRAFVSRVPALASDSIDGARARALIKTRATRHFSEVFLDSIRVSA